MTVRPWGAGGNAYPALDLDDPGTAILLGQTGTLDTTGGGDGDVDRVLTKGDYEVLAGPDQSAQGVNPLLNPFMETLPEGYVDAPVFDGPIY